MFQNDIVNFRQHRSPMSLNRKTTRSWSKLRRGWKFLVNVNARSHWAVSTCLVTCLNNRKLTVNDTIRVCDTLMVFLYHFVWHIFGMTIGVIWIHCNSHHIGEFQYSKVTLTPYSQILPVNSIDSDSKAEVRVWAEWSADTFSPNISYILRGSGGGKKGWIWAEV